MPEEVAVLRTRLEALESRFADHERRQNGSMERIEQKLDAMDEKIDGRPSWAVTWVFTALGSLVVGLAMALIARGG